ncbi:MAG: MgtC/SapB family protein [Clostridia bacterium]|nr:MgtC/SapB family protein [Clostridia bacterium]
MDAFIEYLRDFNIVTIIVRLVLAALFGGVIGLERGRQRRAAGLRTHILVCIGAALTATVGFFARDVLGTVGTDPLRISAQVISGIGFLGVGTILLKGRFQITGLTTAAGLWVTAAIGIALGAGFYEGALVAFLVTVITVMLLHKIERTVNDHHSSFGVYMELKGDASVRGCVELLKEKYRAHDIQVTLPRSGTSGNVGIEASISSSRTQKVELDETLVYLDTLDYVVFAIESI